MKVKPKTLPGIVYLSSILSAVIIIPPVFFYAL